MQNKALRPYLRQSSEYLMDTTGSTAPEPQSSTSVGATLTSYNITEVSFDRLSVGTIDATGTISAGGFVTGASPDPRIEITASLIAGYSDATTKQFYLSATDGKAYAGAGAVILDAAGVTINNILGDEYNYLTLQYTSTTIGRAVARIYNGTIPTLAVETLPSDSHRMVRLKTSDAADTYFGYVDAYSSSVQSYAALQAYSLGGAGNIQVVSYSGNFECTAEDTNGCQAGLFSTPSTPANSRFLVRRDTQTTSNVFAVAMLESDVAVKKVYLLNGADLLVYSDNGSTLKASIDGATGNITSVGSVLGVQPKCKVYNSAAQTIATATVTAITWNSESWDTGDMHSTSTNTDRITAAVAGYYHVTAQATLSANASGIRRIYLYVDGAEVQRKTYDNMGAAYATFMDISADLYLAASSYVDVRVDQDSGGNLTTSASGVTQQFLAVHLMSA